MKRTITHPHPRAGLLTLLNCKLRCSARRSVFKRENWASYEFLWIYRNQIMKTNTYLLVVHHEGMMGLLVGFCPFDSLLPKKEIHICCTCFLAKHKCNLCIQNSCSLSFTAKELLDKLQQLLPNCRSLLSDCAFAFFNQTQYLKKGALQQVSLLGDSCHPTK